MVRYSAGTLGEHLVAEILEFNIVPREVKAKGL